MAGTWCTNQFGFKPQLTTQGTTDKADFDTSMDRIDAKLGEFKVFGDPGYDDLATALATIGSTETTLTIPSSSGAVTVGANATIPANVDLRVAKGSYFDVANGVTLTIQGPINAGPYQIFDWTGTGDIDVYDSPTQYCYLDWWGAVANTTAGSGTECSAVVQKAFDGMGSHQILKLSNGWYTVNHFSLTSTTRTYSIEGCGKMGSYGAPRYGFWIQGDTATDGITFGVTNSASTRVNLRDLAFGGAQDCCRNGVVLNMMKVESNNVNYWMGASEYAVSAVGTIGSDIQVLSYNHGAAGAYGPAGVVEVTYGMPGGSPWTSQYVNLDVRCNGGSGGMYFTLPVISLAGYYSVSSNITAGDVMRITGVVDQWSNTSCAISVENANTLHIDCLYCEGQASTTSVFSNCKNIYFNSFETTDNVTLSNTKAMSLGNYSIGGTLTILPDCIGTLVGSGTASGIASYAGDTIFLNGPEYDYPTITSILPVFSVDDTNYIYNSIFARWQADQPDGGWYKQATQTYTQCTGVQADGVGARTNTYYCKSEETADAAMIYFFDTAQTSQFLGRTMTFSFWQAYPTGQTFAANSIYASISFTCPAWVNSTAYNYGDAVTDGSGHNFLCVGAGTSGGSAPSWDFGENLTTTDGTVTWRSDCLGATSSYNNAPTTSDGTWRQVSVSAFIPNNISALRVDINQPAQTPAATSTMYITEPAAMIGRQTQRAPVANNSLRTEVGGNVLWSVTPTAGLWVAVGDIDLSSGQRCTVAGAEGTSATWSNFP